MSELALALQPPAGFSEMILEPNFSQTVAPLYIKPSVHGMSVGMFVTRRQLNADGVLANGALMCFADLALATAIVHHINNIAQVPTINLRTDYVSDAREGDWLLFEPDFCSADSLIGSAYGSVTGPRGVVARINGLFRLPRKN